MNEIETSPVGGNAEKIREPNAFEGKFAIAILLVTVKVKMLKNAD